MLYAFINAFKRAFKCIAIGLLRNAFYVYTLYIRTGGGVWGGGRLNVLNFFGILASKKAVVTERFKALTGNPEVPSSSPLPAGHGSVYGLLARIPASWVF